MSRLGSDKIYIFLLNFRFTAKTEMEEYTGLLRQGSQSKDAKKREKKLLRFLQSPPVFSRDANKR